MIRRNEQQPQHKGDDRWHICFHAQPYLTTLWYCDGACDGFWPTTPKESGAASLADAQSAAVGFGKQVAPISVHQNEALPHPSREGQENPASAEICARCSERGYPAA